MLTRDLHSEVRKMSINYPSVFQSTTILLVRQIEQDTGGNEMSDDNRGHSNRCPSLDRTCDPESGSASVANSIQTTRLSGRDSGFADEFESHSIGSNEASPSIATRIDNLRRVAHQFLTGETLDRELAEWFGSALQGYLNRSSRTLEEAFGLIFPKGGVPWWREEAIRKRDAALRKLADLFFSDLSPCSQAQKIRTLAVRYAASAWRFDRGKERMPSRYVGTMSEWLWWAFVSGATMPICERQLRYILAK